MKIHEINAKTALVKSNLPDTDYVVNPYSGCAFGCIYCYADFMRKFTGHLGDVWGEYVDVKVNTPEVLQKEVVKLIQRIDPDTPDSEWPKILFSSVTDPYQGVEAKYKLTKRCLQVLVDARYKGNVSILTKSHLVTRDIDILKELPNATVGLTITSTDDVLGRFFEKNAPFQSKRIEALRRLNTAGVKTYVFIGPLFPHYADSPEQFDFLFRCIKEAGTDAVYVEHINLPPKRMQRLKNELKKKESTASGYANGKSGSSKSIMDIFFESQTDKHKEALNEIVYNLLKKYDLQVLGGGIIDHQNSRKGTEFVRK